MLSGVVAAAMAFGLLLVVLHAFAPHSGWPAAGGRSRGGGILGVLVAAFILVLAVGAAALIADMEPIGAVATEARLGLVRAWVTTVVKGEEQLIGETVALAVALARPAGRSFRRRDKARLDPGAVGRKTTRADPRRVVRPFDAELRQYCLRKVSPELQRPLLLCHPPAAIRWAASRILAAGR